MQVQAVMLPHDALNVVPHRRTGVANMVDKEQQEDIDGTESFVTERGSLFDTDQLFVVSNRQPYQHEHSPEGDEILVNRPVGGLTASLDPLMQEAGGTWIAWGDGTADAEVVDDSDSVDVPPEDHKYTLKRVWLSDEQVQGYYYGFSNQVLWPLCHSSLSAVHSDGGYWRHYRETNEQFATKIVKEATDDSIIWIQDYHLALAPWLVRRQLGGGPTIQQFWHIPWPSWDVFRACPHGDALLRGLLGNDVLGFHVDRYVNNFLKCVDETLDDATIDWRSGDVSYRGGFTRVEAIPMGVPFTKIRRKASACSRSDFQEFRERFDLDEDTQIAVGVDRLDYSKGIPERLRALERLWETHPEWRGELTYVQNGSESRSKIDAYQALQNEVDQEIERVNERFGTDDWQPVVRVSEYLSQTELFGLYRHSDVGIVSPIRDGFNLVAAEYAAAQVDGDGVLVLSTQTGAHDLLGEHVVSVPPFDVETFAERLDEALSMPFAERRFRMDHIRRTVADNDLRTWLNRNAGVAQAVGKHGNLIQHD